MNQLIIQAKELIANGIKLGDPELIKQGNELLGSINPAEIEIAPTEDVSVSLQPEEKIYEYTCSNCGEEVQYKKERKACPKCKKHSLKIKPVVVEQEVSARPDPNNFIVPARKGEYGSQKRLNQDGVEVTFTRRQPIDTTKTKINMFSDDGTEGHDKANEVLKQHTKFTPRKRPKTTTKLVKCSKCGKGEQVHPAFARDYYVCNRCATRNVS